MTSDAGRIMDDGTICRLDDDTFYVTTTSSGAGAIEEWFGWWLADLGPRRARHRRHAGALRRQPRRAAGARDPRRADRPRRVRRGLRLPRRASAHGSRASTRCCCGSASSARSATRSTSRPPTASTCGTRSSPAGARPFGLEPQRVLRLQKLHVIVGQDTDSESTPYGAAMPWIVKLDKEQDFIGRWALEHAARATRAGRRSSASRWPTATSRPRARSCRSRRPAGQVTSSRALAAARRGDRDGVGAGRAGRATARRSRSPTSGATYAATVDDVAVLRPRGGGAALVSLAFLSAGRAAGAVARSPMERQAARRRRALRGPRRLERRGGLRRRGGAPAATVGLADALAPRASSSCGRAAGRARRSAPRDRSRATRCVAAR